MEIQESLYGFVAVQKSEQWKWIIKRLEKEIIKDEESNADLYKSIKDDQGVLEADKWKNEFYHMSDLLGDIIDVIKKAQIQGENIIHLSYEEYEGDHHVQDIFPLQSYGLFAADVSLAFFVDDFLASDYEDDTDYDTVNACALFCLHSWNSVTGDGGTYCRTGIGSYDRHNRYFQEGDINYSSVEDAFKLCQLKMSKNRLEYLSVFDGTEFDFARNEFQKYSVFDGVQNYIVKGKQIQFANKQFYLNSSADPFRDKNEILAVGGKAQNVLDESTDYVTIDTNYDSKLQSFTPDVQKAFEMMKNGNSMRFIVYSEFRRMIKKQSVVISPATKSCMEVNKLEDPHKMYLERVDVADEIHCGGLCYVVSGLNESYNIISKEEQHIRDVLTPLGAILKSSMSKKIGLLIIRDTGVNTAKTKRAVELIGEGRNIIVVTYPYFMRLAENGKIIR